MQSLDGKRLLFVGIYDDRKNSLYDAASQLGVKCCSVGTYDGKLVQDKVSKHIVYDTYYHQNDQQHCKAIAELVKSEFGEVDGCITVWDDCIPLTSLLCKRLGTPGFPYSAALVAKKKSLTLDTLNSTPGALGEAVKPYLSQCYNVASLADLQQSSQRVRFPAVLKAEHGAGGMSFKVVQDTAECEEHFLFLQSACDVLPDAQFLVGEGFRNECVLMEFLKGSEHSVDLFLFHGELLCAFIVDKGTRSSQDTTVHTLSMMPSLLTQEKQSQVIRAAFECCVALGLDHGALNVDIMMTQCGPKLIEINARMGGFGHQGFVQAVYNLNLASLTLQLACDLRPDIPLGLSSTSSNSATSNSPCNGVSPPSWENGHSPSSHSQVSCLCGSSCPMSSFVPKPSCVIVGRTIYGWQHVSALRTTARPEVLQKLHNEKKLLFFPYVTLTDERYDMPFCNVAVTGDTFAEAADKLQHLCQDLGLEPVRKSK